MIKRIGTRKPGRGESAIEIELSSGDKVSIAHSDLATHDTPAKLLTEIERQAKGPLPNLYFHLNRDGSVAVATGRAPRIWPEDEKEVVDV